MPDVNQARNDAYILRLQNAIRRLHRCESTYVAIAPVSESSHSFGDNAVWQGEVVVFEIHGHAQAKRAYGWSYILESGRVRHVVVLEIPPVTSPQTAVRAGIAAQIVNGTFR